MILCPSSSRSEIIWALVRYRGLQRVIRRQNPFFYRLPTSVNEYDRDFKLHPIEDFQAVFNHNVRVHVLVDKPGRIFIQSGTKNLIYGNVWMPKDTLIFKGTSLLPASTRSTRANIYSDIFGTLVGERAAGLDFRVTPDVRFSHSANSESWAAAHWRELVHRTWNSHGVDVYISTKRALRFNNLRTTMDTLNDDVLLSIFGSYRLDDDENWNLQLRWFKLIHVCRRWRHLIYGSPSHLNLHLLCTNGTPVADMLNHSPPLPLILNYHNRRATLTTEDNEGILLALQHHDRVRRIAFHAPPQGLHKFFTAMNENFLTLERLSILSTSGDDARLVMPRAFQAPRLSHLTLLGVTLSTEPRSLASTVSLVSLTLTYLRESPYFPPEDLAAQLQFVPLLEELSISISVPTLPRPRIQMRRMESPITRATLPALKRFIFRGDSAYIEALLARISAPCLRKFDITLSNQLIFALPVLSRFIDVTTELRFPAAKINFNQNSLSISISGNREEEAQDDRSLHVQVNCKSLDWQVARLASRFRSADMQRALADAARGGGISH